MSHFAVFVIGEDIEQELAPFQENNMGDCPREYLAFHDCTEEVTDGFEEEKGKYESIEEYAKDCFGYEKDGSGKYGYWENPKAKWDWYQVGGRYSSRLLLKDGRRADSARIRDIDFATIREEAENAAGDEWDRVQAYLTIHPAFEPWQKVRDEMYSEALRDEARAFYKNQSAISSFLGFALENGLYFWDFGSGPEGYTIPRADFVRDAGDGSLGCFAFVKERKWAERGEMGWFAMVTAEKDRETWNSMVAKFIASLGPEELLTVVDCHT